MRRVMSTKVAEVAESAHRISPLGLTLLVHEAEEGGYWGEVYELPGCVSQGETVDELQANIREAIEAVCTYSMAVHPAISYFGPPPTWTTTRSVS